MAGDFVRVSVLSREECADVDATVERLRPLWVRRRAAGEYVFHTLGAASYLDFERYYERAATFNGKMDNSFGWLYARIVARLGATLHCRVALEPDAARPGFHIMGPSKEMTVPAGDVHCDMQFERVAWREAEGIDFSEPLSYTLAIRLPNTGGGLHLWPVTEAEFRAMNAEARERVVTEQAPAYVAYCEGTMVVHSGFDLHTSAPSGPGLRPDDLRLTLQGHAFRRRDSYRLYW